MGFPEHGFPVGWLPTPLKFLTKEVKDYQSVTSVFPTETTGLISMNKLIGPSAAN